MTPRIKRIRKVLSPPAVKGFKPYGPEVSDKKSEPVSMLYEEYEALRLCDYDGYNHHAASAIMEVSRPTFTRIYASARQKIAKAFVEGRQITIEGGKVYFDSNWFECAHCQALFNNPDTENPSGECPLCGNTKIQRVDTEEPHNRITPSECSDVCFCPSCGYITPHSLGKPCSNMECPECKHRMRRKGKKDDRQ